MFDLVPPFVFVVLAALAVPVLPRRAGHALGAIAGVLAMIGAVVAPSGVLLAPRLFGFETVLYTVDDVSRLMGLIFGFLGVMGVIYAWASEATPIQTAFALAYVGTSLGAVFAGDWLTLVFFWELMAVASTLLVWQYGGRAVRPGFRYAVLHGIGGSLLLAAAVWQYALTDSFVFGSGGIVGTTPSILAALGIGVNVGFIGLHAWLPDTYPRPHIAASVFLSVYTTKTGVYAMYRAFPEGHLWIAYMGGAMAVFGAFVALLQHDMRRLLSYHIQSQVGYMVAGVGIGGTLATAGAFGHVFNHILYKSLLFMAVGVIIYRTGRENLKELGGLARAMPITAITFTIAAFSIAGVPGFNGFVSKGMVVQAAHYGQFEPLWALLLIGGVGTFLSFMKLGYFAFFNGPYTGDLIDVNRGFHVALIVVASLCVLLGVYPPLLYGILPGGEALTYEAFTLGHVGEALALGALALLGFVLLRARLATIAHVPDIDAVYNPVVFYAVRVGVHAVTDAFAAVDRAVVAGVRRGIDALTEPEASLTPILSASRVARDPPTSLRAGIGVGTMIIVLVAVGFLGVILVL